MALVSMKLSKKDRKDNGMAVPETSSEEAEEYPWGLQISLEDAELSKLGFDSIPSKLGKKLKIEAEAELIDASLRKTKGKDRKSMRLQITKMDLSEMP